jgi:electron transfer flavoprotein alpha subunit
MAVLVVADHDNQTLKDNTHKTVTAAQAIGGDVDVLVAGTNTAAIAAEAAKIAGVRKVLTAESPELGQGIAEAFQDLIVGLMGDYDAVLTPATSQGKNISPRVAAKLDVAPRLKVLKVTEPPKRGGGIKVESAADLVMKLKNEAGVL